MYFQWIVPILGITNIHWCKLGTTLPFYYDASGVCASQCAFFIVLLLYSQGKPKLLIYSITLYILYIPVCNISTFTFFQDEVMCMLQRSPNKLEKKA